MIFQEEENLLGEIENKKEEAKKTFKSTINRSKLTADDLDDLFLDEEML